MIEWGLMIVLLTAGYLAGRAHRELGGKLNWWFVPYREKCRRWGTSYGNGAWCDSAVWRLRLSSLSPLSKVCRECLEADVKRRLGA